LEHKLVSGFARSFFRSQKIEERKTSFYKGRLGKFIGYTNHSGKFTGVDRWGINEGEPRKRRGPWVSWGPQKTKNYYIP